MPSTNDLRELLSSDAQRVSRAPFPVEQVIERARGARRRRRTVAVAGACAAAGVIAVPVALVQGIGVTIAPAGPPGGSSATSVPVSSLTAEERPVVDDDAGVLQLPLERFVVSGPERYEIQWAVDLLLEDCVADRGLVYEPVDFRSLKPETSRRYGIWTMAEANTLGYDVPPTSEAETNAFASPPSDEVYDEVLSCARSMDADDSSQFARLAVPELDPAAPEGYEAAVTSEEGKSAVADWEACLETAGVRAPTDGWIPPAVQNADRETEQQIAVQDVTCKQQTGLIQRLADLAASYQAAYIRTHETELTQLRRQSDLTLALARQVIAEHGERAAPSSGN